MLKAQDSANDHQLQQVYLRKVYFVLLGTLFGGPAEGREGSPTAERGKEKRGAYIQYGLLLGIHSRTILHTLVTNILSQGTTLDTIMVKAHRAQSPRAGSKIMLCRHEDTRARSKMQM